MARYNMAGMRGALPTTPVRQAQTPVVTRGRRRRRRRNRQGVVGPAVTPTGAELVVRDKEVLCEQTSNVQSLQFNPAPSGLKRLSQFAKMYERYRIISMTITYQPVAGMTASGGCYLGVAPGIKLPEVKAKDDILRLKPSVSGTAFTPHSLNVGAIMPQKWLYCNDSTRDGVAFTLYSAGENAGGSLIVNYHVQFDGPKPF